LGVNKTMNAIFSHERLLLLEKMVELSGFSAVRRSPRPRRGVIHAKARELSFRRVEQLIEFGTVDLRLIYDLPELVAEIRGNLCRVWSLLVTTFVCFLAVGKHSCNLLRE
jgi:hypothetical protein